MIDINSIWNNQNPTGDIIIRTRISEIQNLKCYGATNNITGNRMYIMQFSNKIDPVDFRKAKFKGVRIEIFDFDDYKELNIYLLDDELKEIFSYFIQDILNVVKNVNIEIEALNLTSNIIFKWKSLFDKVLFNGLTIERQKGLIGELLFFNMILILKYPIDLIINNWTGCDFDDKDFVFGNIGVEIKFTSSKVPILKISSERQLDDQNLSELYLQLYIAEEVKEKGISLNSIIEETRINLSANQTSLNEFNEKLILIGYFEEDTDNYNKEYAIKSKKLFFIEKDFPKLISNDLKIGVYNTSYNIEISACEPFSFDIDNLTNKLLLN